MPSGIVGPYSPAMISWRDAGNEPTNFSIFGTLLTAANFVAQSTLWDTLVTAANALTLGAIATEEYGDKNSFDWDQPVNGASREIALLVQYKDNVTGFKMRAYVGTLDPAIPDYVVNANAKDVVLMTSPVQITNFITAFNAFAINPYTGNPCVVYGLKVVRGGK